MKDENGICIECQNCGAFEYCKDSSAYEQCQNKAFFPSKEAYEARIAELQKELNIVQKSERVLAQEADRLRAEVKELEAHNEVLQRRIEEFSMELLDRTMKENKDVLERLKQAESEEK